MCIRDRSCAITSNITARRSTVCTNNEILKTFSKNHRLMYLTDYLIYAFLLLAGALAGILLRMKSSSRYPVPRRSATLTQAQQRPTLDRGEPRVYSQPSANPYVRCFLRARLLSSRHAVYIDTNVHDTLWRVVRACGVRNITLSSYVDAIVREHLERYRTQIEALHAPDDENSRTRCSS